jgi:hypothetical protein
MPNAAFYYEENDVRIYPPKLIYLNVRPEARTLMNCVVFVVRADELGAFNQREWMYRPVVVTPAMQDVRVEGGDAVLYVGRDEQVARGVASLRDAAIRASYVDIIDRALRAAGESFRREYYESTDPLPTNLVVDDVLDPEKPNPVADAGFSYRPRPVS